ncbi:D-alanyl-D-alanine carboxypeptidase family protein [Amphibacillus sediminis]|uniref:D-alanyl-D-alanine carboxypeptidase family protein n=1 Tax=Amphibacillus sediminis TaxID=360185 RepID=UPI000833742B|nr:D-alanyl-D-alanine carboxypeptidase family protein [Amphibacillus sediminis]
MNTLVFEKSDITKGYLVLANASHPVSGKVTSNKLVPIRSDFGEILLDQQAAIMLANITAVLDCADQVLPVSGYRSYQEQEMIYQQCLEEHGRAFTEKFVALPGCSEHQTGLAIDLAEAKAEIDFICPDFPYTGICGRFRELAIEYGFIERYPAWAEAITQIGHEPWHFRYVGFPHSRIITDKRLTLEEYTEYLKSFSFANQPLCFESDKQVYEIGYTAVNDHQPTIIEIPDGVAYQVSGNNQDGVVVTVWREKE